MSSDIRQDIQDSISDINDLLSHYDALLRRVDQSVPGKVELAAMGAVLQSFYNGIEGMFLLISKQIDGNVPTDPSWHQALLNRMTETTADRNALISSETADQLAMYMKFRHFFRHSYSFMLDWERLEQLVTDLMSVWDAASREFEEFADSV